MGSYKGFEIPEELRYDLAAHVWAKRDGDLVVIGATHPAAAYAGDIIHLGIKKAGTKLSKGGILATIESAKFMGPMRVPVAGEVVEVNAAVGKTPVLVNRDPYGNWVAKLRVSGGDEEWNAMVPGPEATEKYRPIIDEWDIQNPPKA